MDEDNVTWLGIDFNYVATIAQPDKPHEEWKVIGFVHRPTKGEAIIWDGKLWRVMMVRKLEK